MKSEPKYRKQLDRNGWMARLQKWMWGDSTPKFSGYCPFFWFTWLTLILSPIGLIFFTLRWLRDLVFSGWEKYAPIPRPSDIVLISFYECVMSIGLKPALKAYEGSDVPAWVKDTPCWKDCCLRALAKYEAREAKAAARAPRNKARVAKAALWAKVVVYPVIGFLAVVVCWNLGKGLIAGLLYLIANITWPGFLLFGKTLLGITLAVGVLYALFIGIGKLWSLRRKCPRDPEHIPWYSKIGMAIVAGLEFVVETIESIYTSECPLIEWSDSSAPIRRAK